MRRIGLTGGIGAGKSTVARRLAQLGAVVVDADQVAREVVAPGAPALAEIAARFGPDVIDGTGHLRRDRLAAMVFSDPVALADLNRITHPRIAEVTARRVAAALAGGAAVLVHDMPLLVENGLAPDYDVVLVVTAPLEVRLERLAARGISRDDALARIAAQATDAQRELVADVVIDNGGPVADTWAAVDAAWPVLRGP